MNIEIYLDKEGMDFFIQVTDALLKSGGEANLPGVLLIKQSIKSWEERPNVPVRELKKV